MPPSSARACRRDRPHRGSILWALVCVLGFSGCTKYRKHAAPTPLRTSAVLEADHGGSDERETEATGQATVRTSAAATTTASQANDGLPDLLRVYAKTRFVWIRERPEWSSEWIGYLWAGGSVALVNGRPIYAHGCDAWYAVRPRGYVCVDHRRATLDAHDPEFPRSGHTARLLSCICV